MNKNLINIVNRNLQAMEDDRKEICTYCGKVCYVKHHKDDVCHEC